MVSLREIKEREYIPKRTFLQILTKGSFSLLFLLLTQAKSIKKLQTVQKAGVHKRPKPQYTIPHYKDTMKYCKSDEKYLRPTYFCDCRSEKIIALANELGAYKKNDREYAEACFQWVKRHIILEIIPLNGVDETLDRGTGTCMHINSIFVALLRCGGIKAKYKFFAAHEDQAMYEDVFDPVMQKWYDALGYFSLEADILSYVDGEWKASHTGPTPERQAGMGIPITKFGESSIGMWFEEVPGTMFEGESLPFGISILSRVLMRVGPGTVSNMNINVLRQIEHGRHVLKEKGSEEAYDDEARRKHRLRAPNVNLKHHDSLVFAD